MDYSTESIAERQARINAGVASRVRTPGQPTDYESARACAFRSIVAALNHAGWAAPENAINIALDQFAKDLKECATDTAQAMPRLGETPT